MRVADAGSVFGIEGGFEGEEHGFELFLLVQGQAREELVRTLEEVAVG